MQRHDQDRKREGDGLSDEELARIEERTELGRALLQRVDPNLWDDPSTWTSFNSDELNAIMLWLSGLLVEVTGISADLAWATRMEVVRDATD